MNIPLVSDVVGGVAGVMQRMLNAATNTLLYEFRVTGTAAEHRVETIPTPILTDPAAVIFGKMLAKRTS